MWSWRPSQIRPHQDSYVDVAQQIRTEFVGAEGISFPTIGGEYNGSLASLKRYIAGVTYD
eukprot:scaffold42039_cov43-Cyclotella_meneghiniana.AAC.1